MYIADETMTAHYGKKARDEGLLRWVEGKPVDYGVLSWILSMRP